MFEKVSNKVNFNIKYKGKGCNKMGNKSDNKIF